MSRRTRTDAEILALTATRIDVVRRGPTLRQALTCAWWLVRAHVADVHLLPREEALEPPPALWLKGLATRAGCVHREPARSPTAGGCAKFCALT